MGGKTKRIMAEKGRRRIKENKSILPVSRPQVSGQTVSNLRNLK